VKTIHQTYFGLRFQVALPGMTEDAAYDARWRLQTKAFELIEAGLRDVPGWIVLHDNNGFETTDPNGMKIERAELCENDDDGPEVDGMLTCAVWFYVSGDFPLALAKSLKEHCIAMYEKAADGLQIQFLRAERNQEFRETVRGPWADV
jgi:hypothetical protein